MSAQGSHLLTVVFVDGGIVEGVDHHLFQIGEVQVPGNVRHQVVKSDALSVPEALVIGAQCHFDSLGDQTTNWVASQIFGVAKHQITDRAALQADIFLLDQLNEFRVFSESKSVSDSPWSEQNCVIKFDIVTGIGLACM